MTPLERYIRDNYVKACTEQERLHETDIGVVTALEVGSATPDQVARWMNRYNLFQHRVPLETREDVAEAFLAFACSERPRWNRRGRSIEKPFSLLHQAIDAVAERKWLSATSKLLWCLYPQRVAMYDRFVLRSLIVLRRIDSTLMRFPALGESPEKRTNESHTSARGRYAAHYAQYHQMVHAVLAAHRMTLNQMRVQHNVRYPYDIRILDKLLWMMGNGGYEFH